jgi:2-polyprenyl-3-methyl-5-hydroxy-6-metoxy-1,4-benzoquinol methylase
VTSGNRGEPIAEDDVKSLSEQSGGIDWEWQEQSGESEFYLSQFAAVRRHVPAGARVLEVGVGAGVILSRLQVVAGCRVVGVDLAPSALQASRATAASQGASLGLAFASGFALPFHSGSFDVVMSFGLIEHFERARAIALLREHRRVCRPGGLAIVSVPNALDLFHSMRKAMLGRRYPYFPERSYSPRALAKEVSAAGLEPIDVDGYAPLWGLRQVGLAYPLVAVLAKTGVLDRVSRITHRRALSCIGNMTLVIARRPAD